MYWEFIQINEAIIVSHLCGLKKPGLHRYVLH